MATDDIVQNNVSASMLIPKAVFNAILTEDKINMCHINVQSLCARKFTKFNELKCNFIDSKMDIVCMTETWLSDVITNQMISMEGYSLLRNDRNRHGGGICIYFKSNLNCKIVKMSTSLGHGNLTEYLLLEVRGGGHPFLIAVYYNPPEIDCSDVLNEHMEEFTVKYNHTFFIGDFNTDLLKSTAKSNRFKNTLSALSYTCVNNESTFFHSNGCSLLDLLITDSPDFVHKFDQVSVPFVSKHDLIFASLNISKIKAGSVSYRDYKNFDASRLNQEFQRMDWNSMLSITDPDIFLDIFNNRLKFLHDELIPLRKSKPKVNPWFNHEIEKAIIDRNVAYSNWKRSRSETSGAHFKSLRNRVNMLIRDAKHQYDRERFNADLPSKQLWSNVKKLGVSKSQSTDCGSNFDVDEMNKYFTDNFTIDNSTRFEISGRSDGFRFRFVEDFEIINALHEIKSNATGLDGIPIIFIKIMIPLIIPYVKHLFNIIILNSKFPRGWKIVKIIPIKKKQNVDDITNLRPISILCALSKVLEKLLKAQISVFITEMNFLHPLQSGFRQHHGTNTALLKVHDDIARVIDKKGIAILLLIDFAKAFDRVSHKKLLMKLNDFFQFSADANRLIHSYLSGRSQAVCCNGNFSNFDYITSGVPQGSVLGPLLFSLFINDLPSSLKYCSIHLFADDVQIYLCDSHNSNLNEICFKINHDLHNIFLWSQSNLLPINPTKTKAMLISKNRNTIAYPDLFFNGEQIEFVDKVSNLGITFTSSLSWDDHINAQCGKIYGCLKKLNMTTRHFSTSTKLKLFKSLILPHFVFGDFLIANALISSIDKLRLALNACVRYVFKLTRYSRVSHLHSHLIGCSFSHFYKFRSCVTLCKIMLSKKPGYLFSKLNPMRSDRNKNYLIPQHLSAYYSQSLFARGVVYWNQLPLNIKSNTTIYNFKRDLKQHLAT